MKLRWGTNMKITKGKLKQVILEELEAVTGSGEVEKILDLIENDPEFQILGQFKDKFLRYMQSGGDPLSALEAASPERRPVQKALEKLRTAIRPSGPKTPMGMPLEEIDRDLAKEGFEELGMFNAKLVNQGHDELADELGQIAVKLQRAGLTSQDFLSQDSLNEYEYDTQSEIYDITQHLSDAAMKLGEFSNFLQGSDERKSAQFASLSRQVKKIHDTVETHIAGIEGRKLYEKFENDQQLRDSKEDVLRQIVAQGQRAKVQGDMVDLFSAGAIVTVLDALSPENKNKFLDFPPYKMAEIAFKLLK